MSYSDIYLQMLWQPYDGELTTPIPMPVGGLGLLGPTIAEHERHLTDAREHKFPLLFQHFGIDEQGDGAWELLARRLAERHVPGMQLNSDSPDAAPFGLSLNFGFSPHFGLCRAVDYLPLKRGRGRPKKPRQFVGGLLGLLPSNTTRKARLGRPPGHTDSEKVKMLTIFEARKRRTRGRDLDVAEAIAREMEPGLNSSNRMRLAARICHFVRRNRPLLKKFGNSAEISPADSD